MVDRLSVSEQSLAISEKLYGGSAKCFRAVSYDQFEKLYGRSNECF